VNGFVAHEVSRSVEVGPSLQVPTVIRMYRFVVLLEKCLASECLNRLIQRFSRAAVTRPAVTNRLVFKLRTSNNLPRHDRDGIQPDN
jgi:hypothetical protein